jgi:lipopolysaccharide/colanic/teichoic acid biosynthesis glycosyltransferase
VKPGLTGLWQISGRYQLDFDERLRLDIAYIRHRCLALDLYILFRTVGAVFSGRGAS